MKYFSFLTTTGLLIFLSATCHAQCEIKSLVKADGSMYYYVTQVPFYITKSREIEGAVVTDKENYFIALYPRPFPPKPDGTKLREDLRMKLSNRKDYALKNYDARYVNKDSVFEIVFLIEKKDIKDFLQNEVESATIGLWKDKPAEEYTFRLHKDAISIQLKCLQDMR